MGKEPSQAVTDHVLRVAAAPIANADPLPGPLLEAFDNVPIKVGQFEVRPVVAADWLILKRLNSPLYRQAIETESVPIETSDDDGIEIIYQFTRPAKEVRAVLAQGLEHFKEQAKQAIADECNMAQLEELIAAVRIQLQRTYTTALAYVQEKESGSVDRNFQGQPKAA